MRLGDVEVADGLPISEHQSRVAFQGVPGAYSEEALVSWFGSDCVSVAVPNFVDVFSKVAYGGCAYGVVPIENSLAGSVLENYDHLLASDAVIVGEVNLPIRHCLMAAQGVHLEDIYIARSHPQALAQCAEYLRGHNIQGVADSNTAGAAQRLASSPSVDARQVGGGSVAGEAGGAGVELRADAVIASERAATIYGLQILARNVQTRSDNTTRFFIIGARASSLGTSNKATIAFGTRNVPGALLRCLEVLERHDLNMTKLESRPTGNTLWEYLFHADIELADRSHLSPEAVDRVVAELRSHTLSVQVLGLYARAL